MIILDSARKQGISDADILDVASDPYVSYRLRSEPLKLLLLGFDSSARAIEVITDTGTDVKCSLYMQTELPSKTRDCLRRD